MTADKNRSLGELEALYQQKIEHWTNRRTELAAELDRCDQELRTNQEKLRWVRTLITAPEGALPKAAAPKGRRRRKSPVGELTLKVLRARPGKWLTAAQIKTLIRKDSNRNVSRQAVNVNLNKMERKGMVHRRPAPAGSGGAQYVYSAA